MRISDWSSDVCSSDLVLPGLFVGDAAGPGGADGVAVEAGHAAGRSGGRSRFRRSKSTSASCRLEPAARRPSRSEEHTSELQSLMRISYAVFCLKTKTTTPINITQTLKHSTHTD